MKIYRTFIRATLDMPQITIISEAASIAHAKAEALAEYNERRESKGKKPLDALPPGSVTTINTRTKRID